MPYSFDNGCSMINQLSTMGLEEKYNIYRLSDGSTIGCTLIDTNGTERYRFLTESYYKKAEGCLLIYDITNRRSFEELERYYIPKIKEKCNNNLVTILLGNKKDMEDKRKVSYEEANNLALKYNFVFKEASCTENQNVFDIFQNIIELTYFELKKNEESKDNESITLSSHSHRRNLNCFKSCCF